MKKLNYNEYIVQGGDWGSFIATIMANNDKEHCKAIHINFAAASPPQKNIFQKLKTGMTFLFPSLFLESNEIEMLKKNYKGLLNGAGYFYLQGTKPQTIGYGLNGITKNEKKLKQNFIRFTCWFSCLYI